MATITRHPADPARLEQRERFTAQWRFISQNYADLLERYRDRFVAVSNCHIIASDTKLFALTESLERDGVDLREVVIEYVTDKGLRV